MVGDTLLQWENLKEMCACLSLTDGDVKLAYLLPSCSQFTNRSSYSTIQNYDAVPHKFLWQVRYLCGSKLFYALLLGKKVPTRDILFWSSVMLNICFMLKITYRSSLPFMHTC